MSQGKTSLTYKAHDARGRLLYVGRTNSLSTRLHGHYRDNSAWLQHCASIEATLPMPHEEAVDLERHLIATLCPPFNVQGNYLPSATRDEYWDEDEITDKGMAALRAPLDVLDEARRLA